MKNTKKLSVRGIKVIVFSVAALICFGLAFLALKPEIFKTIFDNLDSKRSTAMAIAATATGVSVAISLLPHDFGLPIATEISKASSYVLIAVCVLMMEKFMMTAFWFIAFGIVLPLSFILKIYNLFKENESAYNFSVKFMVFAAALVCVVPMSVGLCTLIEKSQDISMQSAMQQIEEIDSSIDDDSGFWQKVKDGVGNSTEKLKLKLNSFIDSLAVMLVTTCGITVLVLLFMFWMIKTLFGIDIKMPKPKGAIKGKKRKAAESLQTEKSSSPVGTQLKERALPESRNTAE